MELNTEKFAADCVEAINSNINSLKTLNIIVVGKTGAGKSTLINSVFREDLAVTGMGKPVTTHMSKISKEGFPVNIYDTRGFELGRDAQIQVRNEIMDTIKAGIRSKDINQQIHCIWYCVNTATNRIEPEEMDWLREFSKENRITNVPVIIVLTQSFSKKNSKALRQMILDEKLDIIQVVPVLAEDYEIDEDYIAKAYGLDVLIQVMTEALPDELLHTLMNTQRASLDLKRYYARSAVAAATSAAFGEGFVPIPFADSALLIPTQVAMIGSITAIFGLRVDRSILIAFVSSMLGAGGATVAGKAIVSNVFKFIPGAGSLLGGTITGSTAAVITSALGEAYIALMEALWLGEVNSAELQTKEGRDKLKEMIAERLKNRKTDTSSVEGTALSDIVNLPGNIKLPENVNLPDARKIAKNVSDVISSGVKTAVESENFDDFKNRVLPKDSKLSKAIEVYKILSSEEEK